MIAMKVSMKTKYDFNDWGNKYDFTKGNKYDCNDGNNRDLKLLGYQFLIGLNMREMFLLWINYDSNIQIRPIVT